jgi:DNA-directed RNA polymerase specialized sigma24 family protein
VSGAASRSARAVPSTRELLALQDELLRFFSRRMRSRAEAQDLLQETNLRVLARGPGDAGRAWLFRVARSVLFDHPRREAARGRGLAAYGRDPASTPFDEPPIVPCGCVRGVLPEMAPLDREVLRRADLEAEPHAAIARSLGTTAGAVGVRLHRARKALRRRLLAHCGGCCSRDPLHCGCALTCKDPVFDASPGMRAGRSAVPPTSSGGWT